MPWSYRCLYRENILHTSGLSSNILHSCTTLGVVLWSNTDETGLVCWVDVVKCVSFWSEDSNQQTDLMKQLQEIEWSTFKTALADFFGPLEGSKTRKHSKYRRNIIIHLQPWQVKSNIIYTFSTNSWGEYIWLFSSSVDQLVTLSLQLILSS